MNSLAVILARAGSRGLPDKCVLPLCGRPLIAYSIGHAQQSKLLNGIVLTTDSMRAAAVGRSAGIYVVDRPPELAADTARVDEAVRHAVCDYERHTSTEFDAVVILYGNIPIRADGIIDRCIEHLLHTGCDSVRTVAPVGKMHPDWMHRLDGDRLVQLRPNSIHRRQDLEPLYYHDAAVIVVRRQCLFSPESRNDPHALFGHDRRGVIQAPEDTVDIDGLVDFYHAEALLRVCSESTVMDAPSGASRRRRFSAAISPGSGYAR